MLKLLFCGDTVPTPETAPDFAAGNAQALFFDILPHFAAADRVVLNLECALTEFDGAIRKFGPNIKGPVESAKTLKSAGVTDCCLANNHMLDFGVQGMRDTVAALENADLNWFGAGEDDTDACRPYIMEENGCKIGIVAVVEHEYTYALPNRPGAAPFDPFDTMVAVSQLKKECDAVVVLYHGGKEHCEYPSPRLRKACHAMAKLGADLVLCQHSHIIGCAEEIDGCTIVYGQGNFHFIRDAYMTNPGWGKGLMVRVDFDGKFRLEYIPVVVEGHGIRLADETEKAEILSGFAARSETLRDGRWLEGWKEFCKTVQESYTNSVRSAFSNPDDPAKLEHFAHYLDCEAHTDVYRELFPTWHRASLEP